MKNYLKLVAVGVVAAASVQAAEIYNVNWNYNVDGYGISVSYKAPGGSYTTETGWVGLMDMNNNTSGATIPNGRFWTYCADVGVWLQTWHDYELMSFADAQSKVGGINPKWQNGSDNIYVASYIYNTVMDIKENKGGTIGGVSSYDTSLSVAGQLAVWEVLYDNGLTYDITDGNFKANGISSQLQSLVGDILSDAGNYEKTHRPSAWTYNANLLVPIENGLYVGSQELLYRQVGQHGHNVPDGGLTFAMLGLGAASLTLLRRKVS